jgi:hypothetical protein
MTDYAKILDLPMGANDANAKTIRAYLKSLLSELWRKEEGFSGKRPFGNSGWQSEVWKALIDGGACPGTLDSDGYVQEIDQDQADVLIQGAIATL